MNPFNKGKILSYYQDALKIQRGEIVYPRMALIYPTYVCNYKCPHCLCMEENKNKINIEYSCLLHIVRQLSEVGVKAIEFCGGGEPTMYYEFERIVKDITELYGMEFGILTNGSILNKHYKLLAEKATYVRISIDTVNPDTFINMHNPPSGFGIYRIMEHIDMLVRYRNEIKSKCMIGLKALIGRDNYYETNSMIDFMKKSGADYIQFKGIRSDKNELEEMEKLALDKEFKDKNDPQIKGGMATTKLEVPCVMSPIHTMIDPYGDVYICCYYQYRKESHKIGNVIKDRFTDIWFSDRHKEVIKNIKMEECNKYDCRFHHYNKVMKSIIKDNDLHINFI